MYIVAQVLRGSKFVRQVRRAFDMVKSIQGINDVSDVLLEWRTFVAEEKEKQLAAIIAEENLKDQETRRFMEHAFRDGSVRTTGTDIDKLMPPISRFGGGNRAEKKQTIIVKLQAFFERFFGIG